MPNQDELATELTMSLMGAFDRALDLSTVDRRVPASTNERVRTELAAHARSLASAFVGSADRTASPIYLSQSGAHVATILREMWQAVRS